ncbi:hypothetical protein [Limibacterium fermenti]|jgi:hypothetical protein|uniref:hypothetical protein n=1 Tax=Limibacterium fermenti TaxID=3229863 RepID=UPI003A610E88
MRKVFFVVLVSLLLVNCSQSRKLPSSHLQWKFSDDGWVLKKEFDKNEYEKFFAIGTWHVPGYAFTDSVETDEKSYENNASLFKKKTDPFNMVFMTPGFQKDYMTDKIHIINPFSPILHHYLDSIPELPKGKDKDYYRVQYLKKVVNTADFDQYLDTEIKKVLQNLPNERYLFSHIDEIALGGVSRWAIPPSVGAKFNQKVKENDKDALIFVDLLGHCRGTTYFFEQSYLRNHDALPEEPPYELLSESARKCEIPLLGFFKSYNDMPVYQFDNGKYDYADYGFETLKSNWYENAKLIAQDYKGCGDVFGINAFWDFSNYPVLSGITVDALRAGLGADTPIWIYFDGNGYARPAGVSPEMYVELVKCQIYTAVIHGATGILFWNDWSKKPEVFDTLLPMLKELNKNLSVIELKTVDKKIDNNLHILIKQDEKGQKYIIATNTSKTDELQLIIPTIQKKELAPLEVFISPFQ